ncbi:MAG: hypothetical protein KDB73_14040 [Planctomycetes bacterium]|nr:hypothetical protein [Planctomycetota bacterium]
MPLRTMTACALLLLVQGLLSRPAAADPVSTPPEGARIRLESMRTLWCVGDNVSVRYVVENVGDEPFKVTATPPGSDDWWILQVFDASGEPVISPRGTATGSWVTSTPRVTVASPFARVVSLVRYGVLDRAGRYRVRLFHALGWKRPEVVEGSGPERRLPVADDPRWAETWIELVEPTPEHVEAVLDALALYPDREARRRSGQEVAPEAAWLRHPAYLVPLLQRLRSTDRSKRQAEAWIRGIQGIPTVESTEALVDLLATPEEAPWRRLVPPELLARALMERVPLLDGHAVGLGGGSESWGYPSFSLALPIDLRAGAWSERLAPRLRAWACEQVDPPGDLLRHALGLLAVVGATEDWQRVEPLLVRLLDDAQRMPAWPPTPETVDELNGVLRVCGRAQREGMRPSSTPASTLEITSALVWMADHPEQAVVQYGEHVAAWLDHENPIIRALTLAALSRSLPGAAARRLEALLDDDSAVVRRTALSAVRREPHDRYRGGVMRAYRRAETSDDLEAARVTAVALGVDHVDLLLVDAGALADAGAYPARWQRLVRATRLFVAGPQEPPPPNERQRLARAWSEYLQLHRDDIGRRGRGSPSPEELHNLTPR